MERLLSKDDIGNFCVYAPEKKWSKIGKLKGFNNENKIAWIVFNCADDWDNFTNYTGQSCEYIDFEFQN